MPPLYWFVLKHVGVYFIFFRGMDFFKDVGDIHIGN